MKKLCLLFFFFLAAAAIRAQNPPPAPQTGPNQRLENIRMRDVCILADPASHTYYAIGSGRPPAKEGYKSPSVRAYTSKDLVNWEGPHIIFQVPANLWGDTNI